MSWFRSLHPDPIVRRRLRGPGSITTPWPWKVGLGHFSVCIAWATVADSLPFACVEIRRVQGFQRPRRERVKTSAARIASR